MAKEYLLAEAVIERVSRLVDPLVLYAVMREPDVDLSSAQAAKATAARLAKELDAKEIELEAQYDETRESHRLLIRRTHHGNVQVGHLDTEFMESADFAQIRKTGNLLRGLIGGGASVQRGEHKRAIVEFKEALDWLLDEARRGLNIQRYKGLGEMNPEQLWETTLDPNVRTLLRVKVSELDEADDIFTKLMGDVVEPRRDFIRENALSVANLDV